MMNKGKLIIISAPSGAGKTSLVHYLLAQPELNLAFSVSATSRPKRAHEVEGKDYYFIDNKTFEKHIKENDFAEFEEVYKGYFYGTYKKEIERILEKGKNVIFDIDVKGGLNIRNLYRENSLAIFIKPPSFEVLEVRLRNRKTETEEKIQERLAKAHSELAFESEFDVVVVNDDFEKAKEEVTQIVNRFLKRRTDVRL